MLVPNPRAGIFVINKDGSLNELPPADFALEADFQKLLEDYPSLIPGAQIDPTVPRRWLMVTRELGIAMEQDGDDRIWLDHLFLDQEGIPTLIEVKRKSDTRARREVVAQMLDYAANATAYMPAQKIRELFDERNAENPQAALRKALGDDAPAYEEYWSLVKTNLEAGRIRLVFVADHITPEVQRIVEFLNRQTDPMEVLAVEIPKFEGGGVKALVPRVLGQSAAAIEKKRVGSASAKTKWDWDSFSAKMNGVAGASQVALALKVKNWFEAHAAGVSWGTNQYGSFIPMFHPEHAPYPFIVGSDGTVTIQFRRLGFKGKYNEPAFKAQLRDKLRETMGLAIPDDKLGGYPTFPLSQLADAKSWHGFEKFCTWLVADAKDYWAHNKPA